jgi:hypothetical protein
MQDDRRPNVAGQDPPSPAPGVPETTHSLSERDLELEAKTLRHRKASGEDSVGAGGHAGRSGAPADGEATRS